MRAITLLKTHTGVITLFIALITPNLGFADKSDNKFELVVGTPKSGEGHPCSSIDSSVEAANKEFLEACSASKVPRETCYNPDTIPKCVELKEELDDYLMGGGGDDDDRSHHHDCDELKRFVRAGCTGFLDNAEEARRDYAEYRRELKDLERDRDRAKKEADEKRKEMQDQLNKLDDDAFKEDKEWQETRRELNDEIQKEIAKAEASKTEAWADTRKKLDEIEVAYMDLQKHIRRLQSSIGVMNAQWGIQCRLAADAAAKEAENEFKARLAEENRIVKNYSFATAARKLQNEMKKKRRKITNRYNEVYARCMRGEIEPGAGIRAKITEMEVQVANETVDANNRVARMERLKKETAETLQSILTSIETQKAQRVASLQQAINELDRNHQVRSNQIAMQKMQLMNEMQIQLSNANKEMGNIADQIEEFRRERIRKSAIAKCSLPGKEEKNEALKAYNKLPSTFSTLKSACERFNTYNCSSVPIDKDRPELGTYQLPPICRDFLAAIETAAKKRSTPSTPMVSVPPTEKPQEKGSPPPYYADPKESSDSTGGKTTQ